MDSVLQRLFAYLGPELEGSKKEKVVQELCEYLQTLPPAILQLVQPQICKRLQQVLLHSLSKREAEAVYINTLTCITSLLKRTELTSWQTMHGLINSVTVPITAPDKGGGNVVKDGTSEELKLEVIRCLHQIIISSNDSTLVEVYQPGFLPSLGFIISTMLSLARLEKYKQLCVETLAFLNLLVVEGQAKYPKESGCCFASFLPGITMTLCKIITGDKKQGHKIITGALSTWSKTVTLVLGDANICQVNSSSKEKNTDKFHLTVDRSQEWVENTAEKLDVLIQSIVKLTSSTDWRLRLALAEWASSILLQCQGSLKKSLPKLLEVLVSLVGDEYHQVSDHCKQALTEYQNQQAEGSKSLVEILLDSLHDLATMLPRHMRVADDDSKLVTLKLLNGYLRLLGYHAKSLTQSYAHLEKLSLALLLVLEMDTSQLKIIEHSFQGVNTDPQGVPSKQRKYFRYFVEESIEHELVTLCRLLGQYGDLDTLVDNFVDYIHQSVTYRKQAIFIINEVITGSKPDTTSVTQDASPHVRSLLECYLSDEYFNVNTGIDSTLEFQDNISQSDKKIILANQKRVPKTLQEMNNNILQVCLLLEGIGSFAKVLGPDFQLLLMDALYPVMEKVADDRALVCDTAHLCLLDICKACNYDSIDDLLSKNCDYLVNSISLHMSHLSVHPKAPIVVAAILRRTGRDILPLMRDTIQEVLTAVDLHYHQNAYTLIRVLYSTLLSIHTWYCVEQSTLENNNSDVDKTTCSCGTKLSDQNSSYTNSDNACVHRNDSSSISSKQRHTPTSSANRSTCSHDNYGNAPPVKNNISNCVQVVNDIKDFFAEYHRNKQILKGDLEIDESEDTDFSEDTEVDTEMEEDKEEEVPNHIKLVEQVLEKCVHLVSLPDVSTKLLVLDTIAVGCTILKQYTNVLLPIVHKLWSPFVHQFKHVETVVIIKAVKVLLVLSGVSEDFIKDRTTKHVFPEILRFLRSQAKISCSSGPGYKITQMCRLQTLILRELGMLCRHLEVNELQLADILAACVPYLSARQPKVLQEACIVTFRDISQHNPDIVWLALNDLHCPRQPSTNSASLKPIKMCGASEDNEFSENVKYLLFYL